MKRVFATLSLAAFASIIFFAPFLGTAAQVPAAKPSTSPTSSPTAIPTPPVIDDSNEIIKVDTELVNVNVRVIDRNNRPINNVQQKEFKIFEDGVPQQIDFFSRSEV